MTMALMACTICIICIAGVSAADWYAFSKHLVNDIGVKAGGGQGCPRHFRVHGWCLANCHSQAACHILLLLVSTCLSPLALQGIQLVKQLKKLDSQLKQDAEVAVYLKQFEQAEALYRRMDRPDLAVDMRMRLGDWLAVSASPHN